MPAAVDTCSKPKVLVSNDDGVAAPGLRAFVKILKEADCCDVYVCGPAGERSAQSHAITLRKPLEAWDIPVPGAVAAFAVDGTPADSVMLAVNSSLFEDEPEFDLVLSGINRGDNAGLHVIYSGTVGAAREAACKGLPAMALSLDSYEAKTEESFEAAASLSLPLIRAALRRTSGGGGTAPVPKPEALRRHVINVNFPRGALEGVKGYSVTRQGDHCVQPYFRRVGDGSCEATEHDVGGGRAELRRVQRFSNIGRHSPEELEEGTDYWAVKNGWVSVCPLALHSHATPRQVPGDDETADIYKEVCSMVVSAAAEMGLICKL